MTRLFDHLDCSAASAIQITTLLENHRAFLRYLERRVGDSSLAEDILQDAFCQSGRATGASADRRSVDQFRRRGAADRAFKAFARELEVHETPTSEMEGQICVCVSRLTATLKAGIR